MTSPLHSRPRCMHFILTRFLPAHSMIVGATVSPDADVHNVIRDRLKPSARRARMQSQHSKSPMNCGDRPVRRNKLLHLAFETTAPVCFALLGFHSRFLLTAVTTTVTQIRPGGRYELPQRVLCLRQLRRPAAWTAVYIRGRRSDLPGMLGKSECASMGALASHPVP